MIAATAAVFLSAGLVSAVPSGASGTNDDKVNTTKLTKAVQVNGVLQHLRQLQVVANRNDGNRASGLPGYEASSTYVAKTLRQAGYKVRKQTFTFPFFSEDSPTTLTQLSPQERDLETAIFTYSGSGDVSGPVVPTNDLLIPAPEQPASTSGCEAEDFEPAPSEDAIALIQRGSCDFGLKARNAEAAGYEAVIIFNAGTPQNTELSIGTLGEPVDIPVVGLSYEDGVALAEAESPTAQVVTDTTIDLERETHNLIADWPGTTKNDDQAVVVGAHLDSVADGPGVNDNGTGVAGILEVAEEMAETGYTKRLQRPVRFAFWGAEELGLLGAQHYVDTLSDRSRAKIYANLNFDMLGSSNYVRLVYDGDGSEFDLAGPAGSSQIEDVFTGWFDDQDLETDPTAFDGRSDYGPFIEYGIPAGGLFSGADDVKTQRQAEVYGGTAGEMLDPDYHTPQDTIDKIDTTVLGQLTDGAAHAVATLTLSKQGLYGDGARRSDQTKSAQPMKGSKDFQGDLALR
ncbi:M20/M25/M40 family metallo-hydrolase [Aeromicrobium sp. CF4.19]|uniref:M20/M25/M40 family metallo-hydrolase n=1 Tax=Aeromicrobium sp. CF4.19 TaxID=3373082 RepID=UPI003EE57027